MSRPPGLTLHHSLAQATRERVPGQVTAPLWASVSPAVKWGKSRGPPCFYSTHHELRGGGVGLLQATVAGWEPLTIRACHASPKLTARPGTGTHKSQQVAEYRSQGLWPEMVSEERGPPRWP